MKKLTVLVLVVLLAVTPFASLAETVTWEDVGAPFVDKLGLEGDFVALEEMGLAFWLPAGMQYVEPSEEDAAAGRYAIFADDECAFVIDTVNVEGMTLDQAYENAVASGMFEPEIVKINGIDALTYKNEAINGGCVVLVDTNCNMIIFTFTPIEGENAEYAYAVISSSIMPLE